MRYPEISIKLYNAIVKQILLYASDFWGVIGIKNNPVEAMHTSFCRQLLGLSKRATINASLLELGFHPLHIDAKKRALRNWLRISKEECNAIIKENYFQVHFVIEKQIWPFNIFVNIIHIQDYLLVY